MHNATVQFAKLHNVFGKPATHGGFTFIPAVVELEGSSFSIGFALRDVAGDSPPAVLMLPIEQQYDAAWVRARLPCVFEFAPQPAEAEKSLLDIAFVAVPIGSAVGFPFICTDYYGRSGLMFSPNGPPPDMQTEIAVAFWSLLLEKPYDLADFHITIFHPGANIWMHFGCENGEPFCRESQDENK